ncbi:MAG: hypothetical protein R2712_28815 [Vicinamibacterales bacterium]
MVRDALAPNVLHQGVVLEVATQLRAHVRARRLGIVCVAPVDVVLDESRALDIVDAAHGQRRYEGAELLRSNVLPDLAVRVQELFNIYDSW